MAVVAAPLDWGVPDEFNLPLSLDRLIADGAGTRQLIQRARQHVGQAGLEQTAALEQLLAIAAQQDLIVRALRDFAATLGEVPAAELSTRTALLAVGEAQLSAVRQLQLSVGDALRRITSTPVETISAATLRAMGTQAREGLAQLERLLADAQQHADGDPTERAALTELDARVRAALDQAQRLYGHNEAASLAALVRQALHLICAGPAPASERRALLEELAQVAQREAQSLTL